MAYATTYNQQAMESYCDTKNVYSAEITLSGTPGTVTTITLPSYSKGFRVWPRSASIRFNVGGTSVAAVGTSTDTTVASTVLTAGGIAKNDMWETRLLPDAANTSRVTLTLASATASVVVDLEVF